MTRLSAHFPPNHRTWNPSILTKEEQPQNQGNLPAWELFYWLRQPAKPSYEQHEEGKKAFTSGRRNFGLNRGNTRQRFGLLPHLKYRALFLAAGFWRVYYSVRCCVCPPPPCFHLHKNVLMEARAQGGSQECRNHCFASRGGHNGTVHASSLPTCRIPTYNKYTQKVATAHPKKN